MTGCRAGRPALGDRALESLARALAGLQDRAEALDGPTDLLGAFFDSDDHPEFDADADANYCTGIVQGIADALGVTVSELLERVRPRAKRGSDHARRSSSPQPGRPRRPRSPRSS